jgi:hypothetical protein
MTACKAKPKSNPIVSFAQPIDITMEDPQILSFIEDNDQNTEMDIDSTAVYA